MKISMKEYNIKGVVWGWAQFYFYGTEVAVYRLVDFGCGCFLCFSGCLGLLFY